MRAVVFLADYAVVNDGKLTAVGAGWTFTGPDPMPSALALMIEVPWDRGNERHRWSLSLKDGDGNAFADAEGNELRVGGEFETGRPAGHPPGTGIPVVLAINLGPLPLMPGSRYVWELRIDDEERDDWRVAFNMRPRPGPTGVVG